MSTKVVDRAPLTFYERTYLPTILGGLKVTAKHFADTVFKGKSVTMQYPEERWVVPEGYRGAPYLVKDQDGATKCVSCQLCEFVCPPKAIRITPGEIPEGSPNAHVEKAPKEFEINMLRCIYCGLCQEVCPEEAIWLQTQYSMTGLSREEMVNDKARLYELGGTLPDAHRKWDVKKAEAERQAGGAH